MKKNNIIWATIIVVVVILGIGGYLGYQKLIVKKVNTQSSFDLNAYLPKKVILSTFTSGNWGTFNADHTITLGWALDYAGPNDTRPHSGVGNWNVNKNVLTITGSGGLVGKYDFSKLAKINVGDKIIYADQYSTLDDGRYVGVFIGDNFTTIDQKTGTKFLDQLDQVSSASTNQTSGWKTYKNDKYVFQLEYPKDWNVVSGEKRSDGEFAFCNQDLVALNSQCQPVFSVNVPDNSRGISLYILDAQKVQSKYGIHVEIPGVWWDKTNNRLYELSYSDYSANIPFRTDDNVRADAFNKITSTFKLIDQTINWKTYSGYGISFKYPDVKEWGNPQVNTYGSGTSISFGGYWSVEIMSNYNNETGKMQTFDEFVQSRLDGMKVLGGPPYDITEKDVSGMVSVNGMGGKIITYKNKGSNPNFDIYYPLNESSTVMFENNNSSVSDEIFNNILSTFKIIK
ncbi:MAG: hypothetical protein NTV36_02690 [Candidatus Staskawiczbacteria bacterium]|nr:hypothetical protein [Candidatus Staskawiczbacteria bacterium]